VAVQLVQHGSAAAAGSGGEATASLSCSQPHACTFDLVVAPAPVFVVESSQEWMWASIVLLPYSRGQHVGLPTAIAVFGEIGSLAAANDVCGLR